MVKPKVFISYAKEDRSYVYELSIHLKWLVRSGVIDTWSDLAVLPGSVYEAEIIAQLETADIVIFLVSADFIASDYLQDIEIKKAIDRYENGEVAIIPVIIRPCDFDSTPLNKFQVLPKNAIPVSTWEDKDLAWLDIVTGIKKVISRFDEKKKQSRSLKPFKIKESSSTHFMDSLKSDIAKDNIEKAIKELLAFTKKSNNDLYDSLIILLSRSISYKRKWAAGLISDEQADITKKQIKNTLLSMINSSHAYAN